jgi:photosystem II stability/assembly factor-like uncharacterized protein
MRLALLLLLTTLTAQAQWDIEDSHTTASLRGIHNVGGGIAWASGTNGTVLRTEDGGYLWQGCATPPGAEKLDFRGIQAFDENTAIVMSSGKGDLSRLYKTTDGCRTWKLVFTNPDKEGFWDALQFTDRQNGYLLGDPVPFGDSGQRVFAYFHTADGGQTWLAVDRARFASTLTTDAAIFAASNSSMLIHNAAPIFVTGGSRAFVIVATRAVVRDPDSSSPPYTYIRLQMAEGATAGGFSLALADGCRGVAVGGDYSKPNEASYTAAHSNGCFLQWSKAETFPHGYRSAVAYDEKTKTWITVGPNGTDISRDDGTNWTPLKPTQTEPQDADKNWNALSLPFVVGPNGRIGKLRPSALKP